MMSAVAIAVSTTAPAFATSQTFTIEGNGYDSDTQIEFQVKNEAEVFQENKSTVENKINIQSDTGKNSTSKNTGGDVMVKTGDVEIQTAIMNKLNTNEAVMDRCGDCQGDTEVMVSGNGADSDNKVSIKQNNSNTLVQENDARISNKVYLKGNSGKNDADKNTGGDVSMLTGDVIINPVMVKNFTNTNHGVIGGGVNGSNMTDIVVSGNGYDSRTAVSLMSNREASLFQMNSSKISNDLQLEGTTGVNSMDKNTSAHLGDFDLETGDVGIIALVDNESGFNAASADCGCVMGVTGSVTGNGTDSRNKVALKLDENLAVAQDNSDYLKTNGDLKSDTGRNDVDANTNGSNYVRTGTTLSVIEALTSGGTNLFGDVEFVMPWGMSFAL